MIDQTRRDLIALREKHGAVARQMADLERLLPQS